MLKRLSARTFKKADVVLCISGLILSGCGSSSDSPKSTHAIPAVTMIEQTETSFDDFKSKHKCAHKITETSKGLELKTYTVDLSCPLPSSLKDLDVVVSDLTAAYNYIKDHIASSGATVSQANALDAYLKALKSQLEAIASTRAKHTKGIEEALKTVAPALTASGCSLSAYERSEYNNTSYKTVTFTDYDISCHPMETETELSQRQARLSEVENTLSVAAGVFGLDDKATRIRAQIGVRRLEAAKKILGFKETALSLRIETIKKSLRDKYQIEITQELNSYMNGNYYDSTLEKRTDLVTRLEATLVGAEGDVHFKDKGIKVLGITGSWHSASCSDRSETNSYLNEKGEFDLCKENDEKLTRSFEVLKFYPTPSEKTELTDAIKAVTELKLANAGLTITCATLAKSCIRLLKVFTAAKADLKKNSDVHGFHIKASNKSLTVEKAYYPKLYFTGEETEAAALEFFKLHFSATPPRYSNY